MTKTRLQRKERRNATKAVMKTKNIKLATKTVTIQSPYKGVSGVIIEE